MADVIPLSDRDVRLSDVVSLDCLSAADQARMGPLVVARMPANTDRVSLARTALAALVRRRAPGLRLDDAIGGQAIIEAPPRAASAPTETCFEAVGAISAGSLVDSNDLSPVVCPPPSSAQPALVRYDRTYGVLRATRDIGVGENLGALAMPAGNAFRPGDRVRLATRIGAVRIQRSLQIAQPSATADVFVRDDHGAVFSAPTAMIKRLP